MPHVLQRWLDGMLKAKTDEINLINKQLLNLKGIRDKLLVEQQANCDKKIDELNKSLRNLSREEIIYNQMKLPDDFDYKKYLQEITVHFNNLKEVSALDAEQIKFYQSNYRLSCVHQKAVALFLKVESHDKNSINEFIYILFLLLRARISYLYIKQNANEDVCSYTDFMDWLYLFERLLASQRQVCQPLERNEFFSHAKEVLVSINQMLKQKFTDSHVAMIWEHTISMLDLKALIGRELLSEVTDNANIVKVLEKNYDECKKILARDEARKETSSIILTIRKQLCNLFNLIIYYGSKLSLTNECEYVFSEMLVLFKQDPNSEEIKYIIITLLMHIIENERFAWYEKFYSQLNRILSFSELLDANKAYQAEIVKIVANYKELIIDQQLDGILSINSKSELMIDCKLRQEFLDAIFDITKEIKREGNSIHIINIHFLTKSKFCALLNLVSKVKKEQCKIVNVLSHDMAYVNISAENIYKQKKKKTKTKKREALTSESEEFIVPVEPVTKKEEENELTHDDLLNNLKKYYLISEGNNQLIQFQNTMAQNRYLCIDRDEKKLQEFNVLFKDRKEKEEGNRIWGINRIGNKTLGLNGLKFDSKEGKMRVKSKNTSNRLICKRVARTTNVMSQIDLKYEKYIIYQPAKIKPH